MVELVRVKLHTFTQCVLSHVGPTSSAKVLPEKQSLTFYFLGIILFFVFVPFGHLFLLLTFLGLTNSCPLLLSKSLGSPLKYSTWSELSSACWRGTVSSLQPSLQVPEVFVQSKRPTGHLWEPWLQTRVVQGSYGLLTELGTRGGQEGTAPSQDTSFCPTAAG